MLLVKLCLSGRHAILHFMICDVIVYEESLVKALFFFCYSLYKYYWDGYGKLKRIIKKQQQANNSLEWKIKFPEKEIV